MERGGGVLGAWFGIRDTFGGVDERFGKGNAGEVHSGYVKVDDRVRQAGLNSPADENEIGHQGGAQRRLSWRNF